MSKHRQQQEIVRRRLDSLKFHVLQPILFEILDRAKLDEIADTLATRGLRSAVHVLPDGTVIGGWDDVKAAVILEWEEVDCIIRDDLANAGKEEIIEALIRNTARRRQLSPGERLEVYVRARAVFDVYFREQGDLLNRAARALGRSRRMLDRRVGGLYGPLPLQLACIRGEINQANIIGFGFLSRSEQETIFDRIAEGESVREVLNSVLKRGDE